MAHQITEVTQEFIELMNEYRKPDSAKGLIENSSCNVVVFAERMLGIKPYSWQVMFLNKLQRALEDNTLNREFTVMTSRQIGKSTLVAIFSLWAATFNKVPYGVGNNTSIIITSASEIQARKLLYEMKRLIRLGDRHLETTYIDSEGKPLIGTNFFSDLLDSNEPNNTTTITFVSQKKKHGDFLLKGSLSGSTIKSYPPTSSVLGETASIVIVDEAGMSEKINDQFFYDFLYPTGNAANAIRIYTSTPWVTSGFFYRMIDPDDIYQDTPADVLIFTVDAIKLENPSYYETVQKTIAQMNSDGKTDEVQRAYYCRFVKGDANYFDPEKVLEVFDKQYTQELSYKGLCDMGIDFGGQVKSKTVITISTQEKDGTVRRLYHKTYPVGGDLNLIEDIKELLKYFNIQRIIPDDCPAGQHYIGRMKELGWNIHPMSFRTDKVKKYGAFRVHVNKGKVKSYLDEDLKIEFLAMEFGQGKQRSVLNPAPGYSDDALDSLVMSAYFYVDLTEQVKTFDYYTD